MKDLYAKKRESESAPIQHTPLSFIEPKDAHVLTRASRLMRRRPDDELFPALLFSLLRAPREFKKIRSVIHLCRLVMSEYLYKKRILGAVDQNPQKRHLCLKVLRTRLEFPFGSKGVLGIVVVFNLLKQREAFEEQHILAALRRLVPSVDVIKGSFLDYQDRKNQLHTVYLEVEREDNPHFAAEEIQKITRELPDELKGCIEQLVPVTFMRRNEEEVYRNIMVLRDQLRTMRDIPQATITFEEQTPVDLFFTVVLVRLVKGKEPSVRELFEEHHPEIVFIPDRVDIVGHLRKTTLKEATVFRLQIPKSPFFRKDRSVNLYKARSYVVHLITTALGPMRDYNGGLILKQSERLQDFLALMPPIFDEFTLENFFYSITPIVMQSILPASLIKEWFLSFSSLLSETPTSDRPYLLSCTHNEEAILATVRADDPSFKELILTELTRLEISTLELAFSEVNLHGAYCFGLLYRPSQAECEEPFCNALRKVLESWASRKRKEERLRLCLKGSDLTLDPRLTTADQSYIIIKMLFEGLTRVGPSGVPEMAIAESYEASPDHTRYTFRIRESYWSNGAPITAYDFEYSWKKALDPLAHSVFGNTFFLIKNAQKAKEKQVPLEEVGIRAIDSKTLQVDLEQPTPYFLEVAAHWTYALISSFIDRKYPGWAYQAGETYVSNGPFKLADWKHDRALTVVKNPYYWDADAVSADRIALTFVETVQNELRLFENGEIDLFGRPLNAVAPHLTPSKGMERVDFPLSGVLLLWLNTEIFPFNQKKCRQALAYAIDRDALAPTVAHEWLKSAYSLLPSTLSLASTPLFPKRDLEKARRLFSKGLAESGQALTHLEIRFSTGLYREGLMKQLAEQLQEALQIEVSCAPSEWKEHFERLMQGDYQIGAMELRGLWNDPGHMLDYFKKSSTLLNISNWEHLAFQIACQEAAYPDKRKEALASAERLLAEEMPAVPLYELYGSYFKRANLSGVYTSPFFEIDFKWAQRS